MNNQWQSQAVAVLSPIYGNLKATKWSTKYYNVLADVIMNAPVLPNTARPVYEISLRKLHTKFQFKHNKQLVFKEVLKALTEHNLHLHNVIKVGCNPDHWGQKAKKYGRKGKYRKLSEVSINHILKEDITMPEPVIYSKTISLFDLPLYKEYKSEYKDVPYTEVHINEESINNFIRNTMATIASTPKTGNGNYHDTLNNNLKSAIKLQEINTQVGFIPHFHRQSHFGRLYYVGPSNLHSLTTELREAALGGWVNMDISNAVFTWRYNVTKAIAPKAKLYNTLDYIDRKKQIRKEVAEYVLSNRTRLSLEKKVKIIKQAFTALSFGAKTMQSFHKLAINEILYPEERQRFYNHPFMLDFIAEQEYITDTIFRSVKNSIPSTADCLKNGRGISKTKVLAYLYQHSETELMSKIYNYIDTLDRDVKLVKLHDGFYADYLSNDEISTISYIINENDNNAYDYKLAVKHIDSYKVALKNTDIYQQEYQHKQRIKAETLKAGGTYTDATAWKPQYEQQVFT